LWDPDFSSWKLGGASTDQAVEQVRRAAIPLGFNPAESDEYGPLIDAIGDARIVLIGEASHGTHEFCRERARITQRLIAESGFFRSPRRQTGPMPIASIAISLIRRIHPGKETTMRQKR
jgi:hypothetical protein